MLNATEIVMTISTPESISEGGERDNSSEDGDFQISDASKDQQKSSASTPTTVSASVSTLAASEIDPRQRQKDDHDSTRKDKDPISPLEWKRRGNVYFGKEDWKQALDAYHAGLTALLNQRVAHRKQLDGNNVLEMPPAAISATTAVESKSAGSSLVGEASTADPLEVAIRSNMAFVLLKLHLYDRAEEECNQLLSISPFNSKALYRRASAREGLYFSLNNKQIEAEAATTNSSNKHNNTENQNKDCMEQLHDAISDLKQALLYLQKERHTEEQQRQSSSNNGNSGNNDQNNDTKKSSNSGIKRQCQRSLDRLQKEYNRQEKKNFITSHKKLRSQRKRDILRLLLARNQKGQVLHGEAFFLLEWNWWVRWCRYVDFFDVATNGTKKGGNTHIDNNHIIERTQRLLNYFPTGATLPLCVRKNPGDDEDDDSLDEEDDDLTLIVPGRIDNTELLIRPDDVFFRQWYLPFPTPHNGKNIDNNDFVASSLKPNLIRGYHYEILPREVYNALRSWYGETTLSICRRVTADGKLMIYPTKSSKLIISCQKPQRCNACRAPGATSRCKQCMMVQYCNRACQESHWRFHRPYCKPRQIGKENESHESLSLPQIPFPSEGDLVGLNNLGNTCFMNSALQSLSHATPMTRHFLSDRFRSDLNKSNPLGTGGRLALAYEAFLKDVWMKPGITSSSPTALKRAIALFAPRFAGYQQHDAQEFLAFLLDGLHEDLNRIRRAPYVEMPDVTDGQNMKIAAAEAWNAHKRRNDSLVMDTFYGQFQSTCVCPRCDRVSVSFDTFNHVSLEIPSNHTTLATMAIPVLVHFADGNRRPVRYGVTVRQQGFVFDLKSAVANLSQIIANKLVLTDVYENAVYKLLDDKQSLSTINQNEDTIVAYEVTPYTVEDTLHMIVSHSLVIEGSSENSNDENQNMSGSDENNDTEQKPIGLPFMTSIEAKNSTYRDLWELMCGFVRRIVKSTVDDTGETINGETSGDSIDVANNCRLDDVLTVHLVDAQGRPRCIFEKTDNSSATNILPHESEELLSTILGDSCAENFLFLTLVWNSPTTYNEKTNIVINPNRFLDFDNHPTLVKAMREQQSTNLSATDQGVTLHHCFQSFSKPERLDVDNMWYCSKCRQHVQALKTMKLWQLPNILVIHLKRFEFKHALRRDKLGSFVGFPLAGLDMSPHCAHLNSTEDNSDFIEGNIPADYDLFAVVNHYGRLGFGHYTAFAMQWDETGISKKWNAFDDSTVRPIQPSKVQSPAAYILFYRRRVFH